MSEYRQVEERRELTLAQQRINTHLSRKGLTRVRLILVNNWVGADAGVVS